LNRRIDFVSSRVDDFSNHRSPVRHHAASLVPRRFSCTRSGVVNPPPSAFSVAVVSALSRAHQHLLALFPGRPKGGS
jgi:hypothetical protein